jgi:SNF2 family DNA or RNA helicase
MFIGKLHPYQEEAVERFLIRKSLLIAYGCGTGKTVMAIAAAEKLMSLGEVRQVLILCPASLKYQWKEKLIQFTDSPVLVIDGDKNKRRDQVNRFIYGRDVPYIICSYESVLYDYEEMTALNPDMVICDEVSAIKSFKAKKSKRVKKMFRSRYRMGLTATPIENRPEELYSIMQWVDDTVLGRYDLFERAYIDRNKRGWVTAYKNLDVLFGRMGDALARKTRFDDDVRPYLPDVDEDNWTVPMPDDVAEVYKIIAGDMVSEMAKLSFGDEGFDPAAFYSGADESTPPGKLMAMHMCMEMLLDHPDLVIWSGMEYMKDSPNGSEYAYNLWQSGVLDDLLESEKVRFLKGELEILAADPESKIIIVSKYKYMLEILQSVLPYESTRFTGDMGAVGKQMSVGRFRDDPDCKILLLSYAGGYGLDLNMADILINFDLPWSFGMQDQINSRHIRASSEFDKVYIRNMITDDSIEERKQRILDRKRKISLLAIDGGEGRDGSVTLDGDLLKEHLEMVLTSRWPKHD